MSLDDEMFRHEGGIGVQATAGVVALVLGGVTVGIGFSERWGQ